MADEAKYLALVSTISVPIRRGSPLIKISFELFCRERDHGNILYILKAFGLAFQHQNANQFASFHPYTMHRHNATTSKVKSTIRSITSHTFRLMTLHNTSKSYFGFERTMLIFNFHRAMLASVLTLSTLHFLLFA